MRYLLSRLVLLVALIFISSAALANQTADSAQAPITLGAIYNLTGAQAPLDLPSALGAQLAVMELNKQGGLLGKPVKLNLVDGESQPALIQQEAKIFAQNKAISIAFGLSDTNMVLAAAPALTQAHKLFITSGATSPNLPQQIPNFLLLACYTDQMQADTLANFAFNDLDGKTAYILTNQDMSYTVLLAQYFQQTYKQIGGKIVGFNSFKQDVPLNKQLKMLAAIKPAPDIIFLAAGPTEAAQLITQIRQAGYKQPILGGDSFDSATLLKNIGKPAGNIYYTTHAFISWANPNKKVQHFIRQYKNTYHQLPANSFAGLGYDTVNLIAAAITKAQSTDPLKVRQAMYEIKNWPGVTGSISYNNSPIPDKQITIIKIHNAKKTLVRA